MSLILASIRTSTLLIEIVRVDEDYVVYSQEGDAPPAQDTFATIDEALTNMSNLVLVSSILQEANLA